MTELDYHAIIYRPTSPDNWQLEVAATNELLEAETREILGAGPDQQLLALSHEDAVFIGVNDPSCTPIKIIDGLTITGPTIQLFVKDRTSKGPYTLADIERMPEPHGSTLALVQSLLKDGSHSDEHVLQPWQWGAPFPVSYLPDRRGEAKQLGEIFAEIFGKQSDSVIIGPEMLDPIHPWHIDRADLSNQQFSGEMLLDLPSYVTSSMDWFPTPAACVMSLLSIYIEQLAAANRAGRLTPADHRRRLEDVARLTSLCAKLKDTWPGAPEDIVVAEQFRSAKQEGTPHE